MTLAGIGALILAILGAAFGIFFAGKKTGQASGAQATAEAGQVVKAATAAVEQSKATIETAKKVQDATASVSPDVDAARAVLRAHSTHYSDTNRNK